MANHSLVLSRLTPAEAAAIAMVMDGLPSAHSRRAYERALVDFFHWHRELGRPKLSKAVVQRYAAELRDAGMAPSSINQRLSAIRKLALEAADNDAIDPQAASGIRSVKGSRREGRRTGNWLTREQAQMWLNAPDAKTMKGLRNRALLAVLIGCGLRRAEAASLTFDHVQQREGRWVLVDLIGKRDKIRSVPMPNWAKATIDKWSKPSDVSDGLVFRAVNKGDRVVGAGITPKRSTTSSSITRGNWRRRASRRWKTNATGMKHLELAGRLARQGKALMYKRFIDDFPAYPINNYWSDTGSGASRLNPKIYVVQTRSLVVERCLSMTTDPGDLVLDPTCGSGTTAYVAEQWGRRWITIDTSRVALALARARIMGARHPYYLLADSSEGQRKEAEVTRTVPSSQPTRGDIRLGFVYERVPHVTLKSIANNAEIDVIWEKFQAALEPLRAQLNATLGKSWAEWEIPRDADDKWPAPAKKLHAQWWQQRIARQKEIDASIAAKAEFEYLYDKPYDDKKKVRVAGPFTVESLSPHRVLAADENDELIDTAANSHGASGEERDFVQMILENLKTAGVQQAHKEDKITFTSLTPWPGDLICAEGRYAEGGEESGTEKRAAIFVGPEFGTVSRPDLVAATREAGDSGFDVLIACAFNYDAHSSEFNKLGRIPVLKARMNADLHMADDLKNTGKGNLFVIFGEPDIDIISGGEDAKPDQIRIKINGVDVFHPNTGEVRSDGADGIACWFIDTDYNEESFFVRHAYFLGANDPYKALKTTLKAEVNEEAWETLHSDTSRPFDKPASGRVAVKVINHLGDEVMKVFRAV